MKFESVFGKVGKGILMDALRKGKVSIGKIDAKVQAMVMIPISGAVLLAATEVSARANKLFPEWPGAKRKEWVKAQLRKELRKLGHEEEYIEELVAVAFMVNARIVGMIEVPEAKVKAKPEDGNAKKPAGDKPRSKDSKKGDSKKGDSKKGDPKKGDPKKGDPKKGDPKTH